MNLAWAVALFLAGYAESKASEASLLYGTGENTALDFYQRHISPLRGPVRCPMYPSCSQFAKVAFAESAGPAALLETFDRLTRCGQDLNQYRKVWIDGAYYAWDPPEGSYPDAGSGDGFAASVRNPEGGGSTHAEAGDATGGLAERLIRDGHPDLAILELYRALHTDPPPDARRSLLYAMALAHYESGSPAALLDFRHAFVQEMMADPDLRGSVDFLVAKRHYRDGQYRQALFVLDGIPSASSRSGPDSLAFLRGLGYARLGQWENAERSMGDISDSSPLKDRARSFEGLGGMMQASPRKSPWIAGALSAVIPGSGYAYAGKWGTGLAGLVLNGLFLWTAAEGYAKGHYGMATTATFLGAGWYLGGIRGSARAARLYNRRVHQVAIDRRSGEFLLPPPSHREPHP
jgi:putative component of membrane protein insertase Oxa1/YidC/SpoIIIJ protein YidD